MGKRALLLSHRHGIAAGNLPFFVRGVNEAGDRMTLMTETLVEAIRAYGSCAVAFSAGVDSTVVAKAAQVALGDRAVAVTGSSDSLAAGELDQARELASLIGIRHEVLLTQEMANPDYLKNGPDRCYFCKTELYQRIEPLATRLGLAVIVNGANLDDLGDYRPGMTAAAEHQVCSPLIECGFGKEAVRTMAAEWGLPIWDKPAAPCLSSRIAYGEEVTPERLAMIDQAEQYLRGLGLREVRVRYHRGDMARLEVPPAAVEQLCAGSSIATCRRIAAAGLPLRNARSRRLPLGKPESRAGASTNTPSGEVAARRKRGQAPSGNIKRGANPDEARSQSPFSTEQLVDKLALVQNRRLPTVGLDQHFLRIDAQHAVDRRGHVGRADWLGRHLGSLFVGRADQLAPLHAGAGEQQRRGLLPVVAAGVFVDLRRAAEFAETDDERILQQSAGRHVFDQRRKTLIELGQLLVQVFENLGVMVPAAVVDRHEPHVVLDEPARQEATLPERGAAIAIAHLRRFLIDGECPLRLGREDHRRRPLAEFVVGGDLVVAVNIAGQTIDGRQQRLPSIEPARCQRLARATSCTLKFAAFGSPVLNDS